MTSISNSNVWKFLNLIKNRNGAESWDDYVDKYHGNNNGTVTKGEFRRCVTNEYESLMGEDLTPDEMTKLIDQFFSSIDTNKGRTRIGASGEIDYNALNKDEIAAMEKRFELYDRFNNVIDRFKNGQLEGIEWPEGLGQDFINNVKSFLETELAADIERGCSPDELETNMIQLLAENLPGMAAEGYADKIVESYQQQYKTYNFSNDTDLQGLIETEKNNILNEISNGKTVSMNEIRTRMEKVVNDYIKEAHSGTETCPEKELSLFALDRNAKALEQKLLSGISSDEVYKSYPDEIKQAITEYVNAQLEGATYGDLAGIYSNTTFDNFKQSNTTYKELSRVMYIKDFTSNPNFMEKLIETFGEEFVEIAPNSMYNQIVNRIKRDQTLTSETAVINRAIELILENYSDIVKDSYKNLSPDELINRYNDFNEKIGDYKLGGTPNLGTLFGQTGQTNQRVALPGKTSSTLSKLLATQQNAIAFCDALSSRYPNLIMEVFGQANYEDVINSMTNITDIDDKVNELYDAIVALGASSTTSTEPEDNNLQEKKDEAIAYCQANYSTYKSIIDGLTNNNYVSYINNLTKVADVTELLNNIKAAIDEYNTPRTQYSTAAEFMQSVMGHYTATFAPEEFGDEERFDFETITRRSDGEGTCYVENDIDGSLWSLYNSDACVQLINYGYTNVSKETIMNRCYCQFSNLLDEIIEHIGAVDPSLTSALQGEKNRVLNKFMTEIQGNFRNANSLDHDMYEGLKGDDDVSDKIAYCTAKKCGIREGYRNARCVVSIKIVVDELLKGIGLS